MTDYITLLQNAGLDEEKPIRGISDADIAVAASAQRVERLPEAYCEFLRQCGRSAGLFWRDANGLFPDIKYLKERMFEMLAEEGIELQLERNLFVFSAYQGFSFLFFHCNGDEDPPVFILIDGGEPPGLHSESFSACIKRGIEQYGSAFRDEKIYLASQAASKR